MAPRTSRRIFRGRKDRARIDSRYDKKMWGQYGPRFYPSMPTRINGRQRVAHPRGQQMMRLLVGDVIDGAFPPLNQSQWQHSKREWFYRWQARSMMDTLRPPRQRLRKWTAPETGFSALGIMEWCALTKFRDGKHAIFSAGPKLYSGKIRRVRETPRST